VIVVERDMQAPVDAVWRVLADGWLYATWVVGASRMRDVSADWPAEGAELQHSQGLWPLLINDVTRVLRSEPDHELLLHGKVRPVGEVQVRLLLTERPGGCHVRMEEDAVAGPIRLLPYPVRLAMVHPRNVESLRRLAYLAEGGSR
jgi:hypothetical protein